MEMQCPVRSISLPGLDDPIDLSGLIVVVGPNSSGKSQLLHDLDSAVLGKKRNLVVLSAVSFRELPDFESYLQILVDKRAIVEQDDRIYKIHAFQYGSGQGGGNFNKESGKMYHSKYKTTLAEKPFSKTTPNSEFFQIFGAFHCSALFLQNRLTLMDTCPNFDAERDAPTTTLQALHLRPDAKEKLRSEIAATFNRGVWIDQIGRFGSLVVRVSSSSAIPSEKDRFEPAMMKEHRGIESEGDGIRSYAAICSTLLLERRPLCLIDEPEMCLHPPQAYAMGRFIGKHVSDGTATVVSTHSSHVLRGILEANPKANVIRLSRSGSAFKGRLLKPEALEEATSKPRSRAEAILDGLFAQAVLICESDGDRIVYESAYRTLAGRKLDIRFVTAEGTGGFADPLKLYTALGVPSVVVADLDFLDKDGELKNVLTALGVNDDRVKELCRDARTAMQHVKATLTQVDVNAVIDEIRSLVQPGNESLDRDMSMLRGKLKRLSDKLYPLNPLKKQGVMSIVENGNDETGVTVLPRQEVQKILSALESHGVFLVPVGELESWLPVFMDGITGDDKGKWAMLAAEKIEAIGEKSEDVWAFISTVARFLSERCGLGE